MFYIESSCTGHFMCSDTHYCLGLKETGELMWTRDGGLYHNGGEFDARYVVVEKLRLPEVHDIAAKYGLLSHDTTVFITWGAKDYRIRIVMSTDVSTFPITSSQKYEYVVGARLVQTTHGRNASQTVIEEIHNPSYKQLDEFVAKCVRELPTH